MNTVSAHIVKKPRQIKKIVVFKKKIMLILLGYWVMGGWGGGPEILKYLSFGNRFL